MVWVMHNALELYQDRFGGSLRYASAMSFEERYEDFMARSSEKADEFAHWLGDKLRGMFTPDMGRMGAPSALMGAPEQSAPVSFEELLRTAVLSDPRARGWSARDFERYPFKYLVELFERGDFERLDQLLESVATLRAEWLEKALEAEPRFTRDERAYYRERLDIYFDYWLGARRFVMDEDDDSRYWSDPVSSQVWLLSMALAVPEYLRLCVQMVEDIRPYDVGPYTAGLVDRPGASLEKLCREW